MDALNTSLLWANELCTKDVRPLDTEITETRYKQCCELLNDYAYPYSVICSGYISYSRKRFAVEIEENRVIVTSLGAVLLPRESYYVENGLMNEFRRITKKALSFVFLIASPLMIYFMFYAKEGIFFLSGNAYAGSILPMQIIMPTLLFIGLTNILGIQMLVPMGKEKVVIYSEIAGAIIDVIINVLLIPRFASTGAAIGTLVAEFVVLVVQYIALKDDVTETLKQVHYVRIAIALVLGTAVSLWVKMLNLGLLLTLVISAVLFFGVYGFYLLICKEEMIVEIWNMIIGKTKAIKKKR